jgi:hypothetical protein
LAYLKFLLADKDFPPACKLDAMAYDALLNQAIAIECGASAGFVLQPA